MVTVLELLKVVGLYFLTPSASAAGIRRSSLLLLLLANFISSWATYSDMRRFSCFVSTALTDIRWFKAKSLDGNTYTNFSPSSAMSEPRSVSEFICCSACVMATSFIWLTAGIACSGWWRASETTISRGAAPCWSLSSASLFSGYRSLWLSLMMRKRTTEKVVASTFSATSNEKEKDGYLTQKSS